ncbi:ABC transporter ATP-binding protein [Allorhizocola rhizosphaerae]|uniref:ABC transporter ATP-binding protein n=1 Tax=Allorhizocola rhizosphaerae TaxID=1872709 RepID=UPI000E3C383E|nr:ABC transporter ATP-binding protein [Allorhizocola rhizosphaerae]
MEIELETPYWRLEGGRRAWPRLGIIRDAALRPVVVILVLQLAGGVATALGLLATTSFVEKLLGGELALKELAFVTAAFGVRGACNAGVGLAQARVNPRVRRLAEERLVDASLRTSLSAYDDPAFYDRMHRARDRGLLHLEMACDNLVDVAGAVFSVAAACVSLAVLHPALMPVLLLGVLPEAWAVMRGARLQYASMARLVAVSRRIVMVTELATKRESAAEIRASQAEPFVLREFREAADVYRDENIRVGTRAARIRALGRLMAGAGIVLTFGMLALLVQVGWVQLAAAGTAVLAIRTATAALTQAVLAGNQLAEHGLYIADYEDFLADAAGRVRPARSARAVAPERIELRGVSFAYPGSDRQALHAVDMTLHRGETIALVGENGSGKTTLAKLMAGLYQPTAGTIAWDGVDVATIDPASFADRIVMVLQDPVQWPHTARSNVHIGRHDRDDPGDVALQEAAERSGAAEVVAGLSRGWDTLLSKYFRGGQDLSGGQWQRFAVARGLYRDAPVLIWDEPTAPLDAKAEFAVYESLRKMADGRTVILITHRLASIRHADRIYLLHEGRLAEQGTHASLMAQGGRYAELYQLQARMYGEHVAA